VIPLIKERVEKMIAKLAKSVNGYTAIFERHLKHSVKDVWSMLTDNEKLSKWFDELRVEELQKGGFLTFNMGNGAFEKMEITDLHPNSVLEFIWAEDLVRFELTRETEGCQLKLIEKITKLTDHTPKDLAGWHVCLDVIGAILDGKDYGSRDVSWKINYEKYKEAIENMKEV